MANNDLIDIAIVAKKGLNEELTQKLSLVLGRDLYQTRSLIASKFPRIIFQNTDAQRIKETSKQIDNLGLVSFSFKNNDIKKPLQLFKANRLEFVDDNLVFQEKNAQLLKLEKNNIFLILKGNLKISKEKEKVTNVKKLNVIATLMTGGIPIRRTKQEKTVEITTENDSFLRIFQKNSMDFCLEIRQHGFNYTCLGPEMSPASLQNFNIITSKIKESTPEAIFDDKLNEFPLISNSADPLRSNIDINCKLIYLYHQIMKSHQSAQ
jgi:hypothetical protein